MYSKERGVTPPAILRPHGSPAYRQPPRERLQVPMNYSGHAIVDGEEQPLGMAISKESESASVDLPAPGDPPVPRFEGLPRVSELGDGHRHRLSPYAADALSSGEPSDPVTLGGTEGAGGDPLSSTNSHIFPSIPTKSHQSPLAPTNSHISPSTPINSHQIPSAPTNYHQIPSAPTNSHISPSTPINSHQIPSAPTNSHQSPPTPTNFHSTPPATTRFPLRLESLLPHGTEDLLILGLILFLLRESEACADRGDLDETVILLGLLLLLG